MEGKPTYEEIVKTLPDDVRLGMDELMGFFHEQNLRPHWYAANAMNIKYRGKIILRFTVTNGRVDVYFTVADAGDLDCVLGAQTVSVRQFFFENLRLCTHCNPRHGAGKPMTILGRAVNVCAEPEIKITNPSREQVQQLKSLALLRRENILFHQSVG